jgi:hypothetical protein
MTHHPHVHMIVPGGGISLDGTRWVSCRPGFLLPVRVPSRLFRRLSGRDRRGPHGGPAGVLRRDLAPASSEGIRKLPFFRGSDKTPSVLAVSITRKRKPPVSLPGFPFLTFPCRGYLDARCRAEAGAPRNHHQLQGCGRVAPKDFDQSLQFKFLAGQALVSPSKSIAAARPRNLIPTNLRLVTVSRCTLRST